MIPESPVLQASTYVIVSDIYSGALFSIDPPIARGEVRGPIECSA
jgi:hypothetical protein